MFQFYNLVQNLTALENVELASQICREPIDAMTVLKQVGLENRAANFPAQLSGGEQQRVAIGLIPEARANLYSRNKYSGLRVNRETAMILAMRVALYEGSWEKYHKGTDFATEDNSEEFFKEVMNWGD